MRLNTHPRGSVYICISASWLLLLPTGCLVMRAPLPPGVCTLPGGCVCRRMAALAAYRLLCAAPAPPGGCVYTSRVGVYSLAAALAADRLLCFTCICYIYNV